MAKYNSNLLIIIILVLAIVISGCTNAQDITPAFKALPEVQQFLSEHPNAKITVTFWSKEEITKSVQEISQLCDKPITPIAMYKATISEGDLKVVSWINAENQIVVCSITQGSGGSQARTPTPIQTSATIVAPTISISASSYPDTTTPDLVITHKGGDALKGGNWKLSIVPIGSPPSFIASSTDGDFSTGNRIIATTTTDRATGLTNSALIGVVPLSSGAKYDVKLVHISSNAMLLDTVVEVREESSGSTIKTPTPVQTSTSNIIVDQVLGNRTDSTGAINDNIQSLIIRIKPDAGVIDLRKVILTLMDKDNKYDLKYSTIGSEPRIYSATSVRDEDGSFSAATPLINSGDLIVITISPSAISPIMLPTRKTIWLSLNQEIGQAVNLEITTPNSYGAYRYVQLYP